MHNYHPGFAPTGQPLLTAVCKPLSIAQAEDLQPNTPVRVKNTDSKAGHVGTESDAVALILPDSLANPSPGPADDSKFDSAGRHCSKSLVCF